MDTLLSSIAMMLDRVCMKTRNRWNSLPNSQILELVTVITEARGTQLPRTTFDETALNLFDDIAGLELLTPTQRNQLLKKLWSRYQRSNDDLQRN